MSRMSSWRNRLWRWRRWLIVLLVLLIVRLALPEVMRRVLISQASQMLHARVEVGDVDLSLLRGGVALDDVAVWAANTSPRHAAAAPAASGAGNRPAARSTSAAPSPPASGRESAPTHSQPLISWKRLAIELRWLPLFHKTVQLREVVLDSPHVALDRLANGQINLMALVPVSKPGTAPTPVKAPVPAKPEWSFGVDRFVLRQGGLRFRDFEIKDSEPLDMHLEEIQVRDIALRPGLYGQPATVHLALAFDKASLRLDARVSMLAQGFDLDADLEAHGLPLRRSRLYIPRVGWSALQGEIDAALKYHLETGKQNQVSGTVSLRNVAVRVSQLEEPALAWKDLTLKVDPVDLIAHRAAVADVTLDGASLLLRPHGGVLLPFLAARMGKAAPTEPPTPAAAPNAAPPAGRAGSAHKTSEHPWHWSLAALHISDSRVRLLGVATPVDVGIAAAINNLSDSGEDPGKADLTITVGKGQVALKGAVRVTPPAFGGSLKVTDLSLPELVRTAGVVLPDLLQSATLSSDLTIAAGLAASGENSAPVPGTVQVRGKLSLADLRVTGVAPQNFSLTTKAIDLGIDQLDLPGVMPASVPAAGSDLRFKGKIALDDLALTGPDPKVFAVGAHTFEVPITALSAPGLLPVKEAAESGGPIRVTLGAVRLERPTVQVTRTAAGFALPTFSGPPAKGETAPPRQSASHPIEVAVAALQVDKGAVAISDHTVKPFFDGRLAPLDVDLAQVRWPGPSVGNLKLSAVGSEHGKLDVYGALSGRTGWFQVDVAKLALMPFNPYATKFSNYSVASGTLSMSSKASFDKGNYYADNWITLHDFNVEGGGGQSLFQEQFGIPLTMALALLRDVDGNIDLGIPVSGGAGGVKIGLLTVIRTALQHAIINALASPLKLVGAVFGGKEEAKALAPAPIPFLPGSAEPAAKGAAQVAQLGELLASRPGVGVTLDATATAADARALREQDLLKQWQSAGVFAKLGALTEKGTRDRVRAALEARAKGLPGTLSPADTKALDDWLAKQPPVAPARLRTLAEARLQGVQQLLVQRSGVGSKRIKLTQPSTQLVHSTPAVTVKLGAVGN